MNEKKQSTVKRILGTRGMGAVITAFAGLIIIYVAFGLIDRKVFAGQNVMNLLRSMSKYLLIGVGQSYLLITGNIDLSIGSMVGMSAMISATLMAMGVNPFVAMAVAMACCLVTGVINGMLVGKFKLPPFIATLGTMFSGNWGDDGVKLFGDNGTFSGLYNVDRLPGGEAQTFGNKIMTTLGLAASVYTLGTTPVKNYISETVVGIAG